jgi:hypothetical protein
MAIQAFPQAGRPGHITMVSARYHRPSSWGGLKGIARAVGVTVITLGIMLGIMVASTLGGAIALSLIRGQSFF